MSVSVSQGSAIDPQAVRKALVLGLDGASWDIMDPLLAQGELPNLAKLLSGGVRASLRSTVPPLTAVAWPAFYTGKNPARHGVFAFRSIDVSRYGAEGDLSSARSLAGQTMFDHLGSLGLPVCAYHVPMTYPVWPINGAMIAGYPTPDVTKLFCHPPELAEWVPPPLDSDFDRRDSGPEEVLRLSFDMLDRLTRTMERFLAEDQYHFYMVVEHLTDFFVHRFWKLRDPTFPSHDPKLARRFGDVIAACYRRVDTAIGRILAQAPDDWVIAVVSDHGNGRGPTKWLHVNNWLYQQGLLRPARTARAGAARTSMGIVRRFVRGAGLRGLILRLLPKTAGRRLERLRTQSDALHFAATRAYGIYVYHSVGGIAINLRNRQPQGIVEPGVEYERLRDQIVSGLRSLRDPATGQSLVTDVWRREELYEGPYLEQVPDILYYASDDYRVGQRYDQLVTELDRRWLTRFSGSHRMQGVLALRAPGVFRSGATIEGAEIIDVLPTLYHAMGLPVPADVDGKVLLDAFLPDFLAENSVRIGGAIGDGSAPSEEGYDEQEKEGIKAALRGLGYIE